MPPPANLHELRSTLGVFVQSSRFISNYAHITQALTHLTRSSNNDKPVPSLWTADQQQAYDQIRDLLLDGIHLCPANYLLPFHCGGDTSNDGKAFGIHQYSDLPPGTPDCHRPLCDLHHPHYPTRRPHPPRHCLI
jgi:hypothetical protein